MTTLKTLLRQIFDSETVTDTRIDGFAIVTVPKIVAANDDGQYDNIISAIEDAQIPFHKKIVAVDGDIASGKGKRLTREQEIINFKSFVRLKRGPIMDKYVDEPAKALEFYPNKLKDYNKINKISATLLMKRYSDAATANSGDFDPAFVAKANAFPVDYATALDAQNTVSGKKTTDRTSRNELRIALNDALYQGLHFFAYYTNGNLTAAEGIFDLNTLVPHKRTTILHLNGLITKLATINLHSDNYDITWVVTIHNVGETDLEICLAPNAITACGNVDGKVKTGRTKTFVIVSLGAIGNQFLNLTNLDLNKTGSYQIEIFRA